MIGIASESDGEFSATYQFGLVCTNQFKSEPDEDWKLPETVGLNGECELN